MKLSEHEDRLSPEFLHMAAFVGLEKLIQNHKQKTIEQDVVLTDYLKPMELNTAQVRMLALIGLTDVLK